MPDFVTGGPFLFFTKAMNVSLLYLFVSRTPSRRSSKGSAVQHTPDGFIFQVSKGEGCGNAYFGLARVQDWGGLTVF